MKFPLILQQLLLTNNEGICTLESYIVLSESTLDNPPNTNYTLSVIAGQNGIETEITFEQSEIQSDTIFFNLNLSSCNFNYDDNQEVNSSVDGAYYIKLTALTVCDKVTSWNKIYTSSVPEAEILLLMNLMIVILMLSIHL